jgi:RHS repeat-associated protein
VIAHVGSTEDNPYQYVGALGYYTHYQDPEFKLLQLGYRFYDPETGCFTQQDPAGDGINWYAYCGGNPMGGVDPWGLGFLDDAWGTIRELPGAFIPGVQTGLAAVGSSLTFGYYDGGRFKNEPGFGVSKGLAYVGMGAGAAAGGLAAVGYFGSRAAIAGVAEEAEGLAANRLRGLAFEQAQLALRGLAKNTVTVVGQTARGLVAVIPDSIDGAIWEIKDVAYAYLTPQLQAMIAIATNARLPFNLITNGRVSGPLEDAILKTGGSILRCP